LSGFNNENGFHFHLQRLNGIEENRMKQFAISLVVLLGLLAADASADRRKYVWTYQWHNCG
jgi:hypothetical protein